MSEETHCRVGKVRMKAGGAEITVLPGASLSKIARKLISVARNICVNFDGCEWGGYIIMAWDMQGQCSFGYYVAPDSVLSPEVLPLVVADKLRRRMV